MKEIQYEIIKEIAGFWHDTLSLFIRCLILAHIQIFLSRQGRGVYKIPLPCQSDTTSKLKKYFPKNTTPKQMEDAIIKLLERELQRKRGRDSR